MLFTKDASQAEKGWSKNAAQVAKSCFQKQIPFYVVTATTDAARKQLKDLQHVQYLKCDATVIKTAGRVNPTFFIMKQAIIIGKHANADYDKVVKQLAASH
jgi:signal recognition particle GTPase